MRELFKNANYDFMGPRRKLVGISLVLLLFGALLVGIHGIKLGIEFSGGTEVQLKYAATPDVAAIRSALEAGGMEGAVVTTIGAPEENEVYIRLAATAEEANPTQRVVDLLHERSGAKGPSADALDLNVADEPTLETRLKGAPGLDEARAAELAQAISAQRKQLAIFHSLDDVAAVSGMTPEVRQFLAQQAWVGPMALRSQSYVGPAVGRELVFKALWAIGGSLAGMLAYIWFRFQFQWGLAAVIALVHDTVITLGLFSLFGMEMSLAVVAAFLTLIGYSVNDSVVVFDRIRENLQARRGGSLEDTINLSINQTLSRTTITSMLTWFTAFALYLFGGPALNPFSFVLVVGVIVGTYSSVYIACPLLVLWQHYFADRRKAAAAAPVTADAPRKAKKVRSSTSG